MSLINSLRSLSCLAILLCSCAVNANGIAEYGDGTYEYEVHYSVFASTFLKPEIAKAYDIIRSPSIAVVNIAVRRKREVGTVAAIARVKGYAQNLLRQRRELSFSEVREQNSIYYLAQFRHGNGERLSFQLELMPDMRMGPVPLKFSKDMYIDSQ